jgi:nitrite reductase/ring-hydroxylating ferredoxin subunit
LKLVLMTIGSRYLLVTFARQPNTKSTMNDTPALLEICPVAVVPEGGVVKIEAAELTLAVFNLGNTYYVTDDACTHGPGSLSEGCIDGENIECDFHNGIFNIRTGAIVAPPCMIPLRTFAVTVVDGRVFIDPAGKPLVES